MLAEGLVIFLFVFALGYTTTDSLHGIADAVWGLLQVSRRPAEKHGATQGIFLLLFFISIVTQLVFFNHI